jgi:hypothetical protein
MDRQAFNRLQAHADRCESKTRRWEQTAACAEWTDPALTAIVSDLSSRLARVKDLLAAARRGMAEGRHQSALESKTADELGELSRRLRRCAPRFSFADRRITASGDGLVA